MKTLIKNTLLGGALLLGSSAAMASPINVGGVIWDPNETFNFVGADDDFSAFGSLIETATNGTPGDVVTGYGLINQINSVSPNPGDFCPSCELTFTFSMNLVSTNGTDFEFTNLVTTFWVDYTPDFIGTHATAGNGTEWLILNGNGNLFGSGTNIGTGSDSGSGTALLDVVGGLAMANFDTNEELNGADAVFSSSFQPIASQPGLLSGTVDFKSNSIPEPTSLALLGLGLLGFSATRKRK